MLGILPSKALICEYMQNLEFQDKVPDLSPLYLSCCEELMIPKFVALLSSLLYSGMSYSLNEYLWDKMRKNSMNAFVNCKTL